MALKATQTWPYVTAEGTDSPLYHWIGIKPDGDADFGMAPSFFTEVRDDAFSFVDNGHATVVFIIDANGHVVRTYRPGDRK